MTDDELFCQKCGYKGKLEEQKIKLKQLKMKYRGILLEKTRSPLFLVISIIFSVLTVAKAAPIMNGDFTVLLDLGFMIAATVGLWMCYAAKENDKLRTALRTASIYDAYVKVMFVIWIVIGAITLFLSMGATFIIAGTVNAGASSENAVLGFEELFSIGVIELFSGVFVLLLVALVGDVFSGRRKYFNKLSKFIETGDYDVKKAPVIGSYILGGAVALFGISSLTLSTFVTKIIYFILDTLLGLLGLGDFIGVDTSGSGLDLLELLGVNSFISLSEMAMFDYIEGFLRTAIDTFVGGLSFALFVSGFSALMFGVYYILSAVWMQLAHNELDRMRREIERENIIRLEIDRNTKQAISDFSEERLRLAALAVSDVLDAKAQTPAEEPTAEEPTVENPATAEAIVEESVTEEATAEESCEEDSKTQDSEIKSDVGEPEASKEEENKE